MNDFIIAPSDPFRPISLRLGEEVDMYLEAGAISYTFGCDGYNQLCSQFNDLVLWVC